MHLANPPETYHRPLNREMDEGKEGRVRVKLLQILIKYPSNLASSLIQIGLIPEEFRPRLDDETVSKRASKVDPVSSLHPPRLSPLISLNLVARFIEVYCPSLASRTKRRHHHGSTSLSRPYKDSRFFSLFYFPPFPSFPSLGYRGAFFSKDSLLSVRPACIVRAE